MSTPTMRVCEVTDGEDYSVRLVGDRRLATFDVEVVACGELSDARVRVVQTNAEASEFYIETGSSGSSGGSEASGYSDVYANSYTLP